MAGTDGFGGSFMPRLGDLLIDAGVADAVVFVPIAVGSTSVADWTFLAFKDRLAQGAAAAQRAGLAPDLILWQQGESDAIERTPTAFYIRRFEKMIEGLRTVSQEGAQRPAHAPSAPRPFGAKVAQKFDGVYGQ